MRVLLIALMIALATAGCAADSFELIDRNGTRLKVTLRGETQEYLRADSLPVVEPLAPKPPTREDLINLMGEAAGDPALGAELVVMAEQAKRRQNRAAWLDALRLATWFHDRDERERKALDGVRDRAERAFGELPPLPEK